MNGLCFDRKYMMSAVTTFRSFYGKRLAHVQDSCNPHYLQMPAAFVVSFFFFFKGSAAPRILPSSPPRPSPDPHRAQFPERKSFVHEQRHTRQAARRKRNQPHHDRSGRGGFFFYSKDRRISKETRHLRSAARSEEHTSELQSQSNLVCRLLLEKK